MRSSYQGESVSSAHCHECAPIVVFIPLIRECSIDFVDVNSVATLNDVVGVPWFEAAQPWRTGIPFALSTPCHGTLVTSSSVQYIFYHFLILKSLSILFLNFALLGLR